MFFQIRFVNILFQDDMTLGVLTSSFWNNARTVRLLLFFAERQIGPASVCTGSRGDGSNSGNVTFFNNIITQECIASNTIAYSFGGIGSVYLFKNSEYVYNVPLDLKSWLTRIMPWVNQFSKKSDLCLFSMSLLFQIQISMGGEVLFINQRQGEKYLLMKVG